MKVRHGIRVDQSAGGGSSHLGGKLVTVVVVDTGDRAIRSLAERACAVVHLVRQRLHYCRELAARVVVILRSNGSEPRWVGVVHATYVVHRPQPGRNRAKQHRTVVIRRSTFHATPHLSHQSSRSCRPLQEESATSHASRHMLLATAYVEPSPRVARRQHMHACRDASMIRVIVAAAGRDFPSSP